MTVPEATEATDLDKTRRYLRPVRATIISAAPAGVHLAVYKWLPMFDEWATGPGICGESMRQGPLPEGTEVTCADCLKWQPKYERMLAPGYRPEDDDPDALRQRAEVAEREVAAARKFAEDMSDFCSPRNVAHDYAEWLIAAMDRARANEVSTGTREVRIVVQAPTDENAGQWAQTIRDLVVAEHGQDMRLTVTISPEGAL